MRCIYTIVFLVLSFTGNAQTPWFVKFVAPLDIPTSLSGTSFDLHIRQGETPFFLQGSTPTYGINGSYLGPTLIFKKGDSVHLAVSNEMNIHTTLHWHGLHVPPRFDGGIQNHIHPNTTWSPSFLIQDDGATYWYHTHSHHETAHQATLGLMGMIIVQDSMEQSLVLPREYGVDDIPVIIQSKSFKYTTEEILPLGSESHFLVNSTVYPYLKVPRQLVRLRLLNGSNLRVINIGFSDNRTFYQITTDGSLLEHPIERTRIKLSTGERADILIDCSNLISGNTLYVVNYASELPAGTPGTLFTAAPSILDSRDIEIMKIMGVDSTTHPVRTIPEQLREPHYIWDEQDAVITRKFNFEVDLPLLFSSGFIKGFSINHELFDENKVDFEVNLNDIEIWELYNNTPFSHPFHIHGTQFYILDRNGVTPPEYERGKKDVVLVDPYERVRLIMQFTDFVDDTYRYLYHCHILSHEDEGMMGQFVVKEKTTGIHPEINIPLINVFPNPSNEYGNIHIKFNNNQLVFNRIAIYDMQGKLVFLKELEHETPTYILSTENIPTGTFLIHILKGDDVIGVGKFVRQ